MRDYAKVSPKFWIGATGKRLRAAGLETQVVALYLLSSPHANMLGLFYCPLTFIGHETGLGMEGASKGLQGAIEAGFCAYDEGSEVVWVHEMARFQVGERLEPKDLRCKGVQNEYDSLPDNPFLAAFFHRYATAFCMARQRGAEQSKNEAPSKSLASQEQEQEQEQELNPSRGSPAAPDVPVGFARFWESWPKSPRKGGKSKCLAIWRRAKLEAEADSIVAHVLALRALPDWTKQNGEFIPAPEVYLNGRRWDGAELGGQQAEDRWAGAL